MDEAEWTEEVQDTHSSCDSKFHGHPEEIDPSSE